MSPRMGHPPQRLLQLLCRNSPCSSSTIPYGLNGTPTPRLSGGPTKPPRTRSGSWYFEDEDHAGPSFNSLGGRLYCTTLSAMALEVYYRYMPIYLDTSEKPSTFKRVDRARSASPKATGETVRSTSTPQASRRGASRIATACNDFARARGRPSPRRHRGSRRWQSAMIF